MSSSSLIIIHFVVQCVYAISMNNKTNATMSERVKNLITKQMPHVGTCQKSNKNNVERSKIQVDSHYTQIHERSLNEKLAGLTNLMGPNLLP